MQLGINPEPPVPEASNTTELRGFWNFCSSWQMTFVSMTSKHGKQQDQHKYRNCPVTNFQQPDGQTDVGPRIEVDSVLIEGAMYTSSSTS